MKKIPQSVHVRLESAVSNSFRCKMACDSLDIDIQKKSVHELNIDAINIDDSFNIGVIYGASGSGKTTLAKKLFGDDIFKSIIDDEKPIIEQFDERFNYEDCAAILTGIGLNSVPCWVRPVKTLSNGQRARAEAALLITRSIDESEIIVIDEWTSVVDRTIAKVMSLCVSKFARARKRKIILLTCHHDIIEWIKPDWLIDCNKQTFINRANDDFFFNPEKKSNSQSDASTDHHGNILASIII